MRIMIDMDDVFVKGGFLYLLNDYLKTNYKEDDFKDFYMQDIVPNKEEFFDYFFDKDMYEYAELCEGARESLEYLNKKYEVYICTSYIFRDYPRRCANILSQKFNYLVKELPFLNPNNFIFITDKSLIKADVRIDDRIENLSVGSKNILFTAYHNKNISNEELKEKGIVRANNWSEVIKILEGDLC